MRTGRYEQAQNLLIVLACLLYFTSYFARLNYGVAMAEILSSTGLGKEEAGLVGSVMFVSHGAGQLLSGVLADRKAPGILILCGLMGTAACNLFFPLFDSFVPFAILWGINGIAQAMFWPPLMKILATYLPSDRLIYACSAVTVAMQISTTLLYFFVPLLLLRYDWRSVFYLGGLLELLTIGIWIPGYRWVRRWGRSSSRELRDAVAGSEEAKRKEPAGDGDGSKRGQRRSAEGYRNAVQRGNLLLSCGMPALLLAIVANGFLRDGITTWMPVFLTEKYGLTEAVSIFMNLALPAGGIATVYIVAAIRKRWLRDEARGAGMFFAIGTVFCLLLYAGLESGAFFALFCTAMVTAMMHGANLMLISYLPLRFRGQGAVATVSGLTSAFTYVGSALSTYVFALLANGLGWAGSVPVWGAIGFCGWLCCFLIRKRWAAFCAEDTAPAGEAGRQDGSASGADAECARMGEKSGSACSDK